MSDEKKGPTPAFREEYEPYFRAMRYRAVLVYEDGHERRSPDLYADAESALKKAEIMKDEG